MHSFTDVVEARVAHWTPLWQKSLADLLTEDTTGTGDTEYEVRNAGFWSKTSKKGKRFLFKDLEIGDTNDDMRRHAFLRTDTAKDLVLPKEGAKFLKARGISVKENFKTIKAEVSQVRMREALMISLNGVTFVPPECYAEDEIDAWGKWMSEQFESGTISQSLGGPGFEIEDFAPLSAHEPGKFIQKYRQLMIAAQTRYLEVQYEKMATDEGYIDDEPEEEKEAEGESGSEIKAGPGLLVFGGKAGRFLTHHALAADGELAPGAVTDELASLFGRIVPTHSHADDGVVQIASIITGVSDSSTVMAPRLEMVELRDISQIRDKPLEWVNALRAVDLRSSGVMMYTRYPNNYKSCILEFEALTLDELNSLACGPKLLDLGRPLHAPTPTDAGIEDLLGTPKHSKPNFSGFTPEGGEGYKTKYGELVQNLKDSLRLCAPRKLSAMSPERLSNNFLQSGRIIPQGITEDVRLAMHDHEVACAAEGAQMLHDTLWHCAKCSATAFESLLEMDQVDSDKVNGSLARVLDVDQNLCTQLGCSAGEKKMPLAPPLTRTVACRACGFTLAPKGQALDCCGHCGLSFVTPMKPADFTKLVSNEKAKAAKEEAHISHNQKLMLHWVRTHGGRRRRSAAATLGTKSRRG